MCRGISSREAKGWQTRRPSLERARLELISDWERGRKRPSGPSLKLLSLVKTKGLDAIA
jgi:hypothetical protein